MKALLSVYVAAHFKEMRRVAQTLQASGRYEPRIMFASPPYPTMGRHLEVCSSEGIACCDARGQELTPALLGEKPALSRGPAVISGPQERSHRRAWYAGVPERLRAPARNVLRPFRAYRQNQRRCRQTQRVLERLRPDIMVQAEDQAGYDIPYWIKAGRRRGVPTVIVPFTVANALEPAEALIHLPEHHVKGPLSRMIGALYPRWVYEHKGVKLLRLPWYDVLARQRMGVAPPLPWVLNSGHADRIAVESEHMQAHYLREGIPERQLTVTGALYDDVLAAGMARAAELRADLYRGLGLPQGRRMILTSLPRDYTNRPGCDAGSFDDLIELWVRALRSLDGFNVVVSLHPSMRYEEFGHIEKWGAKIAQDDIARLIPLCDIYVANISATIRMAIACKKPVVNYDVYRFNYTDYVEAGGVIMVAAQAEFEQALFHLTSDEKFHAEISARQAACAERWGCLDGHAADRMLRLFDELVVSRKAKAA